MKQKLKVDLHIHTDEDPFEKLPYNAFEIIDRASEQGFDVIAITNHNIVTYNQKLAEYAEQRGILLLPGMEGTFSRKHVLIINPGFSKIHQKETLENLAKIKNEHTLIIAAHPFFPGFTTLKSLLHDYISLFDAIEFCHYYNHLINFNKKAIESASLHHKPLIGTSDCHNLWQFGKTYSLVEAEKDTISVIKAVKEGKIEIIATPLSFTTMSRVAFNFILSYKLKIPYKL